MPKKQRLIGNISDTRWVWIILGLSAVLVIAILSTQFNLLGSGTLSTQARPTGKTNPKMCKVITLKTPYVAFQTLKGSGQEADAAAIAAAQAKVDAYIKQQGCGNLQSKNTTGKRTSQGWAITLSSYTCCPTSPEPTTVTVPESNCPSDPHYPASVYDCADLTCTKTGESYACRTAELNSLDLLYSCTPESRAKCQALGGDFKQTPYQVIKRENSFTQCLVTTQQHVYCYYPKSVPKKPTPSPVKTIPSPVQAQPTTVNDSSTTTDNVQGQINE